MGPRQPTPESSGLIMVGQQTQTRRCRRCTISHGVDIELSGIGYQTLIHFPPLTTGGGTAAAKTPYPLVPFGAPLPSDNKVKAPTPDNPIQGIIAGGGTVYSFDPEAADPTSTMRLEAWGFRNPYGIG